MPSSHRSLDSLDALTSPSPSPQPQRPSSRKPPSASAKAAGLDSSSELSELTDDEQQEPDAELDGPASPNPYSLSGSVHKSRSGAVVAGPSWEWTIKKTNGDGAADAAHDDEEDRAPDADSAKTEPSSGNMDISDDDNAVNSDDAPPLLKGRSGNGALPQVLSGDDEASVASDKDEGESEIDVQPIAVTVVRAPSPELTEVDDAEEPADADAASAPAVDGDVDAIISDTEEPTAEPPVPSQVSDEESEGEDEKDGPWPEDQQPDPESEAESAGSPAPDEEGDEDNEAALGDIPDNAVEEDALDEETPTTSVPVVPLLPAGSSIMAGQQLIKTPVPSPSPSPGPEPDPEPPAETNGLDQDDQGVDQEAEDERDADVEPETEEAELDLQPAHRAEALDVLAAIELKFAQLRERLYIEKMEELAMEEALVVQGIHPEMIHLQNELQRRHDTRLELAAKKRLYEEENVGRRRKCDENSIWGWWKFEKDSLQENMFADTNRKRRGLERERRAVERPLPVRRIPAPLPFHPSPQNISIRDIIKSAPFSTLGPHSRPKRKRRRMTPPASRPLSYPSLNTLSSPEVQSDLAQLTARRQFGAVPGPELGPGMPPVEMYGDPQAGFGPGAFVGAPQYPHGVPQTVPPPMHGHGPQRPYGQPPLLPPHSFNQVPGRSAAGPGPSHAHGPNGPRRSPSPGTHGYGHSGLNNHVGSGPPMQGPSGPQDWNGAPNSSKTLNGWNKDGRRIANHKERNVGDVDRDLRDGARHKDVFPEDSSRYSTGPLPPHQIQQPHRHSQQHQSLHGIPHHHHTIHRHVAHHHHPPPRASSSSQNIQPRRHEFDRQHSLNDMEGPPAGRRMGPTTEPTTLLPKQPSSYNSSSSYWGEDEEGPGGRDRLKHGPTSPSVHHPHFNSQPGPTPGLDRPQVTAFTMTPSHSQSGRERSPRREREPWPDEGPRRPMHGGIGPGVGPSGHSTPHERDGAGRFSFGPPPFAHPHNHRQNSLHGPPSPMRHSAAGSPPPSTYHAQTRSPTRLPSLHQSPVTHSSTPKNSRPISPLPAKMISTGSTSTSYLPNKAPSGPGTPGSGMPNGGRLDAPFPINGHSSHSPGSVSIYSQPSLTGPMQHRMANSDSPRLHPPKVVQLSNSS